EHSELVRRTVSKLADRCLPEEYRNALEHAARWHDSGKLDDRFQIFLHQGDELAALRSEKPLAKSAEIPTTPARRRTIREASGLPDNFRHEMLSVQIAARYANGAEGEPDLFLYLIGSHHG